MSGVDRGDSLKTAASKLAKYKLDLVAVHEARWDSGGIEPADNYTFLYRNGNAIHQLGMGIFMHKGVISTAKWSLV
jgi:hypothetical protein